MADKEAGKRSESESNMNMMVKNKNESQTKEKIIDKSADVIKKIWLANQKKKVSKAPTSKSKSSEIRRCPHTGKRIVKSPLRQRYPRKPSKKLTDPSISGCHASEFNNDNDESEMEVIDSVENIPDCREFLTNEWVKYLISNVKSKKKKTKSWYDRSQSTREEWDSMRVTMWEVLQAKEVPDQICNECEDHYSVLQCQDCKMSICEICDESLHSINPCHDRVTFDGRSLNPLEKTNGDNDIDSAVRYPNLKCACSVCGANDLVKITQEELCIVVTLKGRFDLNKYFLRCQDCSSVTDPFTVAVTLTSGFWPGNTRKVNYMFSDDVLQMWDMFRKFMPGSSERSFLKSLNAISEENGRRAVINPNSFAAAFKEWCMWAYQKDQFQLKDWFQCPACQNEQHSCHVDGNCKLYRYKRGKRKRKSFYEGKFILDNTSVSSFINEHYKSQQRNNISNNSTCGGTWTAAKNNCRKMAKLDETGLEVATCRHVLAQKALNMFRGEVFGYPLYLIKNFMVPQNVKFCFADVMCKLWPFICHREPSLVNKIRPALSVMHAKGHSLECQVNWSGEWLDETGRSTGEETEQLFSYLSRFGNTTKHQTPENREETLTEMALHWNKLKVVKMVLDLKKRYLKNEEMIKMEVFEVCDSTIKSWKDEIQKEAKGLKIRNARPLSDLEKALLLIENIQSADDHLSLVNSFYYPITVPKVQYFRLLDFDRKDQKEELDRLRPIITQSGLKEAHKTLSREIWKPLLEQTLEVARVNKIVVSAQVQNTADTSKRRHTIRKKLAVTKNKEKKVIGDYLRVIGENENTDLSTRLQNGFFPWRNDGSSTVKKRVTVENFLKRQHVLEEKAIIKREMWSVLNFFRKKIVDLQQQIQDLGASLKSDNFVDNMTSSTAERVIHRSRTGLLSLKNKGLQYYRLQLEMALRNFIPIIDPETIHDFKNFMDFEEDGDEIEIDEEDDEKETSDDDSDMGSDDCEEDDDEIPDDQEHFNI